MVDFLFLYNNNNLTGLHYIKNTNNLIKQELYMDHEDHDETAHLVASKKIMTAENQKSIGLRREQNTTTEMISRDALFFFQGRVQMYPAPTTGAGYCSRPPAPGNASSGAGDGTTRP